MAVIFVPGIKGSQLVDTYPVEHTTRWSLEDMVVGNVWEDPLDFELVDGRYDRGARHLFREGPIIEIAYGRLIDRLRRWVEPEVYVFAYDWRKPIESSAEELVRFTEHVRGKMAATGRRPLVSFVTHSMGGLVLRSALSLRRPRPFEGLGRIVFVAPPFRGSCDIAEVLVAGERNGWLSDEEDFRKLARGFPSVYQLIPSFPGAAVDGGTGEPLDLFDLGNWQANVVSKDKLSREFMVNAEAHRRGSQARLRGRSVAPLLPDDELQEHAQHIAVVQGAGKPTTFRIRVERGNPRNPNWFDFEWARKQGSDTLGDGPVHLRSSAIEGITLGAFEGAARHALSCRDSRIVNSVIRWLQGRRLLKMKPRTRDNSVNRPSHTYFAAWDGDIGSLGKHIVRE